jgi:peptidoglycan/xylan/chitin deacetylase (PgdA/CDA1 family)
MILRQAVSRLAQRGAVLAGVHHMARRGRATQLLICCYHGVKPVTEPAQHWLLLREDVFAAQMAYVAAHYECVPLDEALARLASGTLRRPTAAVTFDDGYANNATVALPILARLGIPATIYLTTGLLGTDALLWTVALEHAFVTATAQAVDLGASGVPPAQRSAPDDGPVLLTGDAERRALARRVAGRLKDLPAGTRRAVTARLEERLGAPPHGEPGPFRLMSWDDVRAVAVRGLVTFAAHTAHHEIVSRLDDGELDAEIRGSLEAVTAALPDARHRSATFAYPNGRPEDFDARATRLLSALGLAGAVSTLDGLNDRATDRWALRRLVVGPDTSFDAFRLRAAGFGRDVTASRAAAPAPGA